jgi:hypothetical protein
VSGGPVWAVLAQTNPLEAEVLKAALEMADIPVVTRREAYGRVIGLTVGDLGEVEVLVPEERLAEARSLTSDSHSIGFPDETPDEPLMDS